MIIWLNKTIFTTEQQSFQQARFKIATNKRNRLLQEIQAVDDRLEKLRAHITSHHGLIKEE